jgi:hypothetical protein
MGMRPLRDQVKDIVHQRNNDVQPREHFLATQWPPAQNTRLETQPSACVIYRSPAALWPRWKPPDTALRTLKA